MNKVVLLFTHELRILLKDRQALALLFIMPLAFIVFLTLALQDVYQAKVGRKVKLELVESGGCEKTGSICQLLLAEMRRFEYDIQVNSKFNESQHFEIALVMPANMETTVDHLKKNESLSDSQKIQLVFDPTLDQSVRALVQGHLQLALQAVLIEQVAKEMKDLKKKLGSNQIPIKTVANVSHFSGLIRESAWGGAVLPNPIQQTVPAWALFGMFFIVIPMANSMIRDRRLGVFKRLLSFPVRPGHLLAGKILPFLVINMLQFGLMFAVGVLVLPKLTHLHLDLTFAGWQVLLVTAVCALAATSYGLMISCLAKTPEQASAFGALSVVILAIVGGVMIPRFVMPELMQQVSLVSPLHWGLEAYLDLFVRKVAFAVTLKKLAVLSGFSALCLIVAGFRFRWSEV